MASNVTLSNSFAAQAGPIPLSQLDTNFSQLASAANSVASFSNYYVDGSSVANSVVITIASPQTFSYTAGVALTVKIANTNTGATTINVNSLGAKSVTNSLAGALNAGDLTVGAVVTLVYDGTQFQLQANSNFTNQTITGNLTLSGGTANGVAYLNASKVLTTGSALTFNGSTLGVTANVNLTGTLNFYSANTALFLNSDNTNYYYLYNPAGTGASAGQLAFVLGGVGEKMRLDASGNLGVGTSSPGSKLDVNGAVTARGDGSSVGLYLASGGSAIRYSGNVDCYVDYSFGGSTGSLIFRRGAGATESMRLDASGNLGVGVTALDVKLRVDSASPTRGIVATFRGTGSTGSQIQVGQDTISDWALGQPAGVNSFAFWAGRNVASNGTEVMRLDASGNLGLSVTPSAWSQGRAIELYSSGYGIWNGIGSIYSLANAYYNGTFKYAVSSVQASHYYQYQGQHVWSTAPAGTAGNTITFTQAMTLDASGNLGVGTTANAWGASYRSYANYTYGDYYSSSAGYVGLSANAYYNGTNWIYKTTNRAVRYEQDVGSGSHAWYTAPSGTAGNTITFTQAMTLDASGNLLVGRTTQIASGKLCVQKTSGANNSIEANQQDAGGYNYLSSAFNNAGTYYHMSFAEGATQRGSITSNGSTVAYNTTSDRRLKTNIVNADSASSLIDAIQVRQFDWLSDDSHQRYGMIAQELYEVAPEAVHKPADENEMMAVDYSKLVPMLVKEIQDLRARVAALEGK